MVPCLPDLADRFRDRFGIERIVTSYGTSETGMVAAVSSIARRRRSSGPVAGDLYEVQVVDERRRAAAGRARPARSSCARSYPWTSPMGTSACPSVRSRRFATSGCTPATSGRFDEEGNLCFVDRLADRIRRRGENVASADVEHVLWARIPSLEAAVVAVTADEEGGEDEIKACVVLAADGNLDAAAFWEWCEERLPYFAIPRYLQVFDELPKTPDREGHETGAAQEAARRRHIRPGPDRPGREGVERSSR